VRDGLVAASRQQGVPREYQWGPGVASGNVVVSGAHPGSGSMGGGGGESGGSSVFLGGGGIW
jgi:hypothetical protein